MCLKEIGICAGASIVKWTKQVLRVYESRGFLGQRPISSSNMLFKIINFFMMTSIAKLCNMNVCSYVLKYTISI